MSLLIYVTIKNNTMKKTTWIAIMLVGGLITFFYGLIGQDYGTVQQSNVKVAIMVLGVLSFAAGWLWLYLIQPRNK